MAKFVCDSVKWSVGCTQMLLMLFPLTTHQLDLLANPTLLYKHPATVKIVSQLLRLMYSQLYLARGYL